MGGEVDNLGGGEAATIITSYSQHRLIADRDGAVVVSSLLQVGAGQPGSIVSREKTPGFSSSSTT